MCGEGEQTSILPYVCLLFMYSLFVKTVKLTSPDYQGQDPEEAVQDFILRIKNYELAYEPLDITEDK